MTSGMENGSYSTIYKLSRDGRRIAVKCIPFKKTNFIQIFKYAFKERLILELGT